MVGRLVMLFGLAYGLATLANACDLQFAYINQASPPFLSDGPPDQPLPGIAVEIVTAAAANAGCSVSYVRRPGKRVLSEVGANMHVGALMFSYNDGRGEALVFPTVDGHLDQRRRLARLTYYLYRPVGAKIDWDGISFHHAEGTVGTNLGYAVAADLRERGIKVEEVTTTVQNLDKLRMGRIAAYAMHDYGVDTLLRKEAYPGIEKLPAPLSTRDYYLAFSPKFYAQHRELAEQIWEEVARERERITLARVEHYLP